MNPARSLRAGFLFVCISLHPAAAAQRHVARAGAQVSGRARSDEEADAEGDADHGERPRALLGDGDVGDVVDTLPGSQRALARPARGRFGGGSLVSIARKSMQAANPADRERDRRPWTHHLASSIGFGCWLRFCRALNRIFAGFNREWTKASASQSWYC